MSRPAIAFSSRELFPFGGGGIGTYIAEIASALAPVADVTIVTADWHEAKYHELVALGDPRVDYGGARVAFVAVPEPAEYGGFRAHMHLYSYRVLECLRALYGERGPDLVEFPDFLGEGVVTAQARRTGDPFLASTVVAVRLHTSAEMIDVLNGHLAQDEEARLHRELERAALRDADVLLEAGGDILDTYRRFYGDALAPARRVRHPMPWPDELPVAPAHDGPLRLLYVGRCERRKGVQDLIDALTGFTADWRLTVLGADTATAPLGGSMLRTLQLQAAEDPRIRFVTAVARAELPAVMADHDAVVLPSRWECWPYVALEALAAGVPLLGTRVGGLVEIVRPGVTGWLAPGAGTEALREVLGPLVAEPRRARAPRDGVREHLQRLADADALRAAYAGLARASRPPRPTRCAEAEPLVSAVVHYSGEASTVVAVAESVLAQTYPRVELLVVDDGGFEPADVVLAELAARHPLRVLATPDRGPGAALNFGVAQARGRYVLVLDAGVTLEPQFLARAVPLLADHAWVGAWNDTERPHAVADGPVALLRRDACDFSEDVTGDAVALRLRELRAAGRVIPAVLWHGATPADDAEPGELQALLRGREVAWVP